MLLTKSIGQLPRGLAAEEVDVALVIHDRNRRATVADVANNPATFAHLSQPIMPEFTHLNFLSSRRRGHQMKSAIRRQTQRDRAAAGLELIGSSGGKVAVEIDVAGRVRGVHSRGADSGERDVAGGRDVRAEQFTLNIANSDLAAASLQIQR